MQGKSGAEPFQQPLTVYCTPSDRDIQCGFEGEGASLDPCRPLKVTDLKVWNYDGSSTGQADGHNSEVLLKPRAIFNDPFRALPLLCVVLVSYVHLIWFKRDLLSLPVPAEGALLIFCTQVATLTSWSLLMPGMHGMTSLPRTTHAPSVPRLWTCTVPWTLGSALSRSTP